MTAIVESETRSFEARTRAIDPTSIGTAGATGRPTKRTPETYDKIVIRAFSIDPGRDS